MSLAETLLDRLVRDGMLIPTGVDGVYGRGGAFEAVVDGIERLVTRAAAADRPEIMRFPPVMSRAEYDTSRYFTTFPHLGGSVHSFVGDAEAHRHLLAKMLRHHPYERELSPTGVVLTPAACYPVYPVAAARGPLSAEGMLVDVSCYCFRHEPSTDPARMQSFRQREMVRIGSGEQIAGFREHWLDHAQAIAQRLQLPYTVEVANDAFFGPYVASLSPAQRAKALKLELLIPINPEQPPTACASVNYHEDRFGTLWKIATAEGVAAHTGCIGFGLERWVIALFRHHGMNPDAWPETVRAALWG